MIQYIRNYKREKIGLLYAEVQNNKLYIGYSLLNPVDIQEAREYNQKVKRVNAASYQLRNIGAEAPLEAYKPIFDREKAVCVAKNRMGNIISLKGLPRKVRKKLIKFVPLAERHLKAQVAILP